MKRLCLALAAFAGIAAAQISNTPVIFVYASPSGNACGSTSLPLEYYVSSQTLYGCNGSPGVWASISSGGSGGGVSDNFPAFVICTTSGCQPETTFNNWFVSATAGITFDECGISLQTIPTVQSVIVDIQTAAGVSIFGATKLVVPTTTPVGTTIFQATFAGSPQTAAKGAQFKAVVTQADTGGAALGGYVKCRVH